MLLHLSLPRFVAPLLYQLSKLWRPDLFALLSVNRMSRRSIHAASLLCALEEEKYPLLKLMRG